MMICQNLMMLFYIGSFIISAAVSTIAVSRMDVVYPSIETAKSGEKIIKFRALDQYIYLRLEPAGDVIADEFTMMDGSNKKIKHSINIEKFKRKLYKDRRMGSALYIDDEGPVTINGIISSDLKIEPYQIEKLRKDGRIAHRVSEILKSESRRVFDKIIRPVLKEDSQLRTRQLTDNDCIKIETVFILDSNITGRYKTHLELASYLSSTIINVQLMLDTLNLGIQIVLFGILKLTKENELNEAPYLEGRFFPDYPEYIDVGNLEYKMGDYYCSGSFPLLEQADVVLLISGRIFLIEIERGEYEISVKGSAYFGKVCQQCWKYGIIEDDISYPDDTAVTIVHEIAHLLGSYHDGEGPYKEDCSSEGNHIMRDEYNREEIQRNFSQCSRKSIQKTLSLEKASCIIEKCEK